MPPTPYEDRDSTTNVGDEAGAKAEAPDLDKIGATLKGARERRGLSVRQVHEATGISPAVLYGYEGGKTKPGAREIALLCQALRITPNSLLFGVEDPFGMPALDPASRLARIAEDPALGMVVGMFVMPLAMGALDFEDKRTLFSVALSLIQAKHPDAGPKITRTIEVLDSFMLRRGMTWEKLGSMTEADRAGLLQAFQAHLAEESKNQSIGS